MPVAEGGISSTVERETDSTTVKPAHQALDAAVGAAYGRKDFKNDAERVAYLFELYQKYTSLLPAVSKTRTRKATLTRKS